MLSFETLYTDTQEIVEDSSTTSLEFIKRSINIGAKKFGAILNREWRNTNKTFSVVSGQQYYQTPEDCIKAKTLTVTIATVKYNPQLIEDEDTWNDLNRRSTTSSVPQFWYIRGNDEFGIYPIPTTTVASAGSLNYERRMRDMSQADYKTGTIEVVLDSAAVVGTNTVWTALMVGRSLKIDDASGDGMWYKIASFSDPTHITLENTYAGASASGLSYVIGEIPDIPEEFHESLEDYAAYRIYLRRKDTTFAGSYKSIYQESLDECKALYSSKTSSNYIRQPKFRQGYIHRQPTQGIL